LRNDQFPEAGGTFHLGAAAAGVARDVLAADRTGELELTHDCQADWLQETCQLQRQIATGQLCLGVTFRKARRTFGASLEFRL
jgi:hypothetical protein